MNDDFGTFLANIRRTPDKDFFEWVDKIPWLPFPADWEVKMIPPNVGTVVRFWVRRRGCKERVSVYLDCYEALGCFGKPGSNTPYWEIYPNCKNDNERFAMDDVDGLMSALEKAIDKLKTCKNSISREPC